jgi:rhodanese-related sulfurtransferase
MAYKLWFGFVVFAVMLLSNQFAAAQDQTAKPTQRIAIPDLKKKLDSHEKLLLIDVREDSELAADGAIPGAIHIPVGELDRRMKDVPKDVEIIFYCGGGTRAQAAAEKFSKAGYQAGEFCGMTDWKKANQKVVEKVDRPAEGPIQPKP